MAMYWGSAGDDQFYGRIDGSGRLSFDFVSRFSSDDVSIRTCFRVVDVEDAPGMLQATFGIEEIWAGSALPPIPITNPEIC
jgi:hypothetical protein